MKYLLFSAIFTLLVQSSTNEIPFNAMFDGESLSGWTAIGSKVGNWRVEEGLLVTAGDGKGWLSYNRSFSDFELRLEYKIGRGGNSGVLIRAPHQGDPSFEGMEIQILDDDAPVYRQLKPEQYCGSVYGILAARRGQTRPAGEWNQLRVVALGSCLLVELNGIKVVEGDVATRRDLLPRHGGILRRSGFIGLQSHSAPVQFRKILVREIP
jgi:hypothetical protein